MVVVAWHGELALMSQLRRLSTTTDALGGPIGGGHILPRGSEKRLCDGVVEAGDGIWRAFRAWPLAFELVGALCVLLY